MPKVDPKAVLEPEEVRSARGIAHALGVFEGALFEWMYSFGARAAEPGQQLLTDVDMHGRRAMPVHLKRLTAWHGSRAGRDWHTLLTPCHKALARWLEARPTWVRVKEQGLYLFPSRAPGACDACHGTGMRQRQKYVNKKSQPGAKVKCHHCAATGKRWGVSRYETYRTVVDILTRAKVPKGRRHPHVLRHSVITHLLDANVPPAVIQDRVGHALLGTTMGYVRATNASRRLLERALDNILGDSPAAVDLRADRRESVAPAIDPDSIDKEIP